VPPGPGRVTADLWPDLTEFGVNERFPTDFIQADGTPAEVFSSYLRPTVMRHFQWMREHGIDGVRFLTYEGLPSDHCLRLTGLAGKVIRGEIPVTSEPPAR
jgi:hypothetical protein